MKDETRSFPDGPSVAMAPAPSHPVYRVRPHPLILESLCEGGIRTYVVDHLAQMFGAPPAAAAR